MRAQEIVDMIAQSERFAQAKAFEDYVFRDEPILGTGAQMFGQTSESMARAGIRPKSGCKPSSGKMPAAYRKMRALAKEGRRSPYSFSYLTTDHKLFYRQAKLMEDFEDSFEGACEFSHYFPTYEAMTDYQLRCYFSWRTRVRAGEYPDAPVAFLFVHVYELLCGIGKPPGNEGYEYLFELYRRYRHKSQSFQIHVEDWLHDYVLFYGLDLSLLDEFECEFPLEAVVLLKQAQKVLIDNGLDEWPQKSVEQLPKPKELLSALTVLSRYRAEKSKFIKERTDDVADVAAHVFARMVSHCSKRRRIDYVQGLFGRSASYSYTMFSSAVFWCPNEHEDVTYSVGPETYFCSQGFWYRELPCSRFDTNKELGVLLHAIDARMRVATGYAHPLKERTLPKYQASYVDKEIASFLERKKAQEEAQVRIDRTALNGIRTASVRTREVLLTDDERDEGVEIVSTLPDATTNSGEPLGLTEPQLALLAALLEGKDVPAADGASFLSLAVDAINEAFLDIVGDTVIEYDGDVPVLVEDYEQDVRDALAT